MHREQISVWERIFMYACVCLDENKSMCKEMCVCILACVCNLLAACCMYHCTTLCDCFFQESKRSPLTVVPTEASTHLWQVGHTSSPQIRLPRTGWEVTICSLTMTTPPHTAMHLNFTSPTFDPQCKHYWPCLHPHSSQCCYFHCRFFLFLNFFRFIDFVFTPPHFAFQQNSLGQIISQELSLGLFINDLAKVTPLISFCWNTSKCWGEACIQS